MTELLPPRHLITTALIAAIAAYTGRPVGDVDAPGTINTRPGSPYYWVGPIPGATSEGDAAEPNGDIKLVYQVTAVSAGSDNKHGTRYQAETAADRAREAILGRTPGTGTFVQAINAFIHPEGNTPDTLSAHGWAVYHRTPDLGGGIDEEGPIVNAHERYELWVARA